MGEILFELNQVLRSKQHKLTIQETSVLINCKSKALKDYCVGAIFGGGVSWIATSRLSTLGRLSISAGASALVGLWRLGDALDSCVDHILALEGSRMQRELATIVVTKYSHDPWRMRHISKHFYPEEVFGDSNSDKPELRWRYRNFYSDVVGNGQRAHESNSNEDSQGDSQSNSHGDYNNETQNGARGTQTESPLESDRRKLDSGSKKAPVSSSVDEIDPFDCVFGYPAMEEIHHPTNPSTASSRTHTRKDRRAHRRRRMHHHQDVLLNPQRA